MIIPVNTEARQYLVKAGKFRHGWGDAAPYAILREEWRESGLAEGP